ncbi:hypothetical protein QQG74_09645 [Micromonospora sp. FIMYZ51]|uniref:hypothetical protein n=1 Tax=Micromonospora sp. FIMYZ51 TaxID=3051832 RepID=UPI00311F2409
MDLPLARTTEQRLMVTMCELLGEQNSLLAELRDRLSSGNGQGQPVTGGNEGQPVKLTEPDPLPTQVTEPSDSGEQNDAKKPARRQAAKKATAAGRRTAKGTS